jgi:hypothetical protein
MGSCSCWIESEDFVRKSNKSFEREVEIGRVGRVPQIPHRDRDSFKVVTDWTDIASSSIILGWVVGHLQANIQSLFAIFYPSRPSQWFQVRETDLPNRILSKSLFVWIWELRNENRETNRHQSSETMRDVVCANCYLQPESIFLRPSEHNERFSRPHPKDRTTHDDGIINGAYDKSLKKQGAWSRCEIMCVCRGASGPIQTQTGLQLRSSALIPNPWVLRKFPIQNGDNPWDCGRLIVRPTIIAPQRVRPIGDGPARFRQTKNHLGLWKTDHSQFR